MTKIYPQSIIGRFRTSKNFSMLGLLLIYFLSSWIRWDRGVGTPNQAIFMDLPHRRAYLFSIEIWPEETYYITGILILAALGLFFFTTLFGRLWCGYTCPHTVFVDIFVKIENFFQGDRNSRIKLDLMPMDYNKFIKKLATHICWILVGFCFAFGWVCYFNDAPTLVKEIINFNTGPNATTWLIGLTISTYLFAGYIRQRVCTYMCPYGRFQSAMIDKETTIVSYHGWRGEPRGGYNPENHDLGDCIDCGKCVVVCPMGIDIRNGWQMECIGCGLCVDACNTVMEKLNRPADLIAYDSIVTTEAKKQGKPINRNVFKAKTIIFASVFTVVSTLMIYGLLTKATYTLSILRDRGPLFTIVPDGSIRNTYILKITNKSSKEKELQLTISGIEYAQLMVQDITAYTDNYSFRIKPEEEIDYKVFVKLPAMKATFKEKTIKFNLMDINTKETTIKRNTFVVSR